MKEQEILSRITDLRTILGNAVQRSLEVDDITRTMSREQREARGKRDIADLVQASQHLVELFGNLFVDMHRIADSITGNNERLGVTDALVAIAHALEHRK
jgi:hypothetical protein